jgi:hypothetical protein
MKHIAIYEDFNPGILKTADLFGVGFEIKLDCRTVIRGMGYDEEKVREVIKGIYGATRECTPRFEAERILDHEAIRIAECEEKKMREFIGDKLDDLDCEIIYYRPMFITRSDWGSGRDLLIYAPGANRNSDKELKIRLNFNSKYDNRKEYEEQLPEIINQVKEFAKKYNVTHVLPPGLGTKIRHMERKENDKYFTPIQKFNWEKIVDWY